MRKRAGFNIEDHIALMLYTGEDLASILRRHKETLRSEMLADNLSIVVDQPAASTPDEVYREKISPQELKKLENYTVEVVLGRL
jgi:isoleucyl-tRNA synthetase